MFKIVLVSLNSFRAPKTAFARPDSCIKPLIPIVFFSEVTYYSKIELEMVFLIILNGKIIKLVAMGKLVR